ncbi:MAG: hypothetical protein MI725_05215 [Pirellulales bacterium]|nr:hypothetical protein [Pirellulales bacterium]
MPALVATLLAYTDINPARAGIIVEYNAARGVICDGQTLLRGNVTSRGLGVVGQGAGAACQSAAQYEGCDQVFHYTFRFLFVLTATILSKRYGLKGQFT